MKYIMITFGLTSANFLMQYISDIPNLDTAMERSFFQLVAIIAVFAGDQFNRD